MTERRNDIEVIWEWWKTRTQKEKDEAISVLEVLVDYESVPRAWLQMMIGGFGSAFVVKAIELFESGAFQSSEKIQETE